MQVEGGIDRSVMCVASRAVPEGPTTAGRVQLTHGGLAVRKRYEARGCMLWLFNQAASGRRPGLSSLVGTRGSIIERPIATVPEAASRSEHPKKLAF